MAGFNVVEVATDINGLVDVNELNVNGNVTTTAKSVYVGLYRQRTVLIFISIKCFIIVYSMRS